MPEFSPPTWTIPHPKPTRYPLYRGRPEHSPTFRGATPVTRKSTESPAGSACLQFRAPTPYPNFSGPVRIHRDPLALDTSRRRETYRRRPPRNPTSRHARPKSHRPAQRSRSSLPTRLRLDRASRQATTHRFPRPGTTHGPRCRLCDVMPHSSACPNPSTPEPIGTRRAPARIPGSGTHAFLAPSDPSHTHSAYS
jgi:hypothetical protein